MTGKTELKQLKNTLCRIAKINEIKINERALKEFLLGGGILCGDDTKEDIFSGKRKMSKENKNSILFKGTWKREDFRNKVLQNGEISLFEEKIRAEYPDRAKGKNFEEMMRSLIFQAVFHTQSPMIFPEYRKKICENYVQWSEKEQELQKMLGKNNIVIIKGGPGIGKTQLVKSFIQNMKKAGNRYEEISWNEVIDCMELPALMENVEEKLKRITEYHETLTKRQYAVDADKIKRLQEQSEDTLLVLECPILTEEDCTFLLNNFSKKKIRIIITTRKCPDSVEFPILYCLQFPRENLIKIFETNLGMGKKYTEYFTEEEFLELLKNIDNNTLVTKLLAKMIKNKKFSFGDKKHDLLDMNKWNRCKDKFPKVNENAYTGMKSSNNPVYYLFLFLYKYGLDPYKLEKEYAEMAIWTKYGVPVNELNEWTKVDRTKKLENAIEMGILEYEEDGVVKMPGIIADAIWIRSPIQYKDYKTNILNFVNFLQLGQKWEHSYQMIYQIIWNLIFRFSFLIYKDESDKRRKEWWDIVSTMITILVQMGSANSAKRMLEMMESELKLSYEKSALIQKNKEILVEQKNRIHMICIEIRLMTGERILDCIKKEQAFMEDNPNLMCEILVCMLKFLDRKIEAEFLYIDMETGNIRYGQLREAIGDWEYILVLYESAITRLPKKSITSGLTLAKLYFSAVDSVLKSYLFEKEVKLELKKEGYNKLKECMMQADEIYNKYWWLQSRLKLIYLKILDAIINGYICSEIEQEMEEIHRDMANKMWSWENTLLYNKTEAIYTLYSSRKKPNIKEIKESILRIVNMANDQIDALTREDNKQIDEVVKKTSEALEKEFIEQCQKIYHIAD